MNEWMRRLWRDPTATQPQRRSSGQGAMTRIVLPATIADWQRRLEAEDRWRPGLSARALAHCWHDADGVPKRVGEALKGIDVFEDFEILLAIPEHAVPLPGGSAPVTSDVWALGRSRAGLVSVVIKGLATESFGETLRDWRRDYVEGKRKRLEFLCGMLDLDLALPDGIRYPLLKWTAAAVIEAIRFRAADAMFLVQSFSPAYHWVEDYRAFLALFGVRAEPDAVVSAGERMGVRLHVGWVSEDPDFLTR